MSDRTRAVQFSSRARRLLELGEFEEALRYVDISLAEDPHDPSAHTIRGVILSRLGLVAGSIEAFRTATWLQPQEARHWYNLALQLHRTGDAEEALSRAEEARRLDPDFPGLSSLLEMLQPETPSPPPPSDAQVEKPAGPPVEPEPPPLQEESPAVAPVPPLLVQEFPPEARSWNWGAFWLTPLWALFHRMAIAGAAIFLAHVATISMSAYIAAKVLPPMVALAAEKGEELTEKDIEAVFRPYGGVSTLAQLLTFGNLALAILFGVSGGRWAWEKRSFRDADHFRTVQRIWAIWGWVAFAATLLVLCFSCFVFLGLLGQAMVTS